MEASTSFLKDNFGFGLSLQKSQLFEKWLCGEIVFVDHGLGLFEKLGGGSEVFGVLHGFIFWLCVCCRSSNRL